MAGQVATVDKVGRMAEPSNPLSFLLPLLTQNNVSKTTSGGSGDVAGLQQLLATLLPTTTAAGMDPVIQAIFRQGFEKQMPAIYNASNQAGLRPGSTTQQQLLVNDLAARMSAEAVKAVNQQQQTAGQVATAIAQNTKTPVVEQQTTRQSVDKGNALAGAGILAGAQLLSALLKGSGSSTSGSSKPSASGSVDAQTALDIMYGKKKGDGSATDLLTSSILAGNDPLAGALQTVFSAPTTTGGINPVAAPVTPDGGWGGSGGGGLNFGFNGGGGSTGIANQAVNYGLDQLGSAMGVPYLGPVVAAADLLGINEITQPVREVTNVVSDAVSGVWNAVTSIFDGCYITTAICELEGKPDDCEELQAMRKFRDDWLVNQPAGKELIKQYYEQAPKFLQAIEGSEYRKQLLEHFSTNYIHPAVHAAQSGDNELAFKHYIAMLADANSYLQQ